jgi:hypothetical protein
MRLFDRGAQRGQAIVVMTIGLSVMLAATAVVVDGGNGMNEQRNTQNAVDAAAIAGALVIAEKLGGASVDDGDVLDAMDDALDVNGSTLQTSYYVDYSRNIVGTVGRGGPIPTNAWGIHARASRSFDTLLASVSGISNWTASAEATAMAGALRSVCSAFDGCAVMPMTFSIPITTCDGTGRPLRIGVDWPITSLATALSDTSGTYMSIVPLCKNGPGGVGWLDLRRVWQNGGWQESTTCTGNLEWQIRNPCNAAFDLPVWLHTQSGNSNSVEDALNTYRGQVILIPMFDATCRDVPSTGLPADCTDPGNGNNLYYHIPRFAYFLLHEPHVQGGNSSACNSAPGQPLVGGNGGTSCIKGWFLRYVTQGRVGQFAPCDGTEPNCFQEPTLGVQLVR